MITDVSGLRGNPLWWCLTGKLVGCWANIPSSWWGKNGVEGARFLLWRQHAGWMARGVPGRMCQEWLTPSRCSSTSRGAECSYPTALNHSQVISGGYSCFGGNYLALSSPWVKSWRMLSGRIVDGPGAAWWESSDFILLFYENIVILHVTLKPPHKKWETNCWPGQDHVSCLALTHDLGVFWVKTHLL